MKRLGALVGVVAMVAAAFFVRGTSSDDSDGQAGSAGADGSGLLCPTELADVCREASSEVQTAVAGDSAATLIEATSADVLGAEAWILPAAWARVVVAERERLERAPIFDVDDAPLASAPVMIAAWADAAEALQAACGDALGWRCLAEQSGQTVLRNTVRVGAPRVDTATGLTVAAAQAVGLLGTSDFAANDFDEGDFRTLAIRLAEHQNDDPLGIMRLQGPGALTVVAVLDLDGRRLSSSLGVIDRFDQMPPVRADIVALVPAGESLSGATRDALTDAFVGAGWAPPADGPDGLPDGGVLAAIRTLWNESR